MQRKIGIMFAFIFIIASLITMPTVEAKTSNISLQAQIKKLKKELSQKNKEIAELKKKSFKVVNAQVLYNGGQMPSTFSDLGVTVPAIIENKGILYTPLSYISGIYGIPSNYDGKSNILYLGNKPEGVNMSDVMKPYDDSCNCTRVNESDFLIMNGIQYFKGYVFDTWLDNNTFSFNLQRKYKQFQAKVGLKDNSENDAKIRIYGDGKLLYEAVHKQGDIAQDVELDVNGIQKFEIKISGGMWLPNVVVANPILK